MMMLEFNDIAEICEFSSNQGRRRSKFQCFFGWTETSNRSRNFHRLWNFCCDNTFFIGSQVPVAWSNFRVIHWWWDSPSVIKAVMISALWTRYFLIIRTNAELGFSQYRLFQNCRPNGAWNKSCKIFIASVFHQKIVELGISEFFAKIW